MNRSRSCLLLLVVPLLLVLTSCEMVFREPIPPSLTLDTIEMEGIDTTTITLNTEGPWHVVSSSSWVGVDPSSGDGPTRVSISIDTAELEPNAYTGGFTVSQSLTGQETFVPVSFSFPKLRGSAVMGPAPSNSSTPLASQALPQIRGSLLVAFHEPELNGPRPATSFRSMAKEVVEARPGMTVRRTLPGLSIAVVDAEDMRRASRSIAQDPRVRYVEPDHVLRPLALDAYRSLQWSHDVLRVDEAWTAGDDGTGAIVAVIDAGFDREHPDLLNNVAGTFDFVSGTESLTARPNCQTHGEHVAGIVAAESNTQGVAGIAADAGLLLLNVGSGEPTSLECPLMTSDIIEALDWVTGDGSGPRADIVNMSLGGSHSLSLAEAIERAYRAGVTLVAAAGNSASSSVLYPAAYPEVIAVSATGRADEIATYSTTGPEVFVSAPGGNGEDYILSTVHDYEGETVKYDYGYMQGTSMASPAAAAVAALVLSVDPSLTPVEVAGLLADTSEDLGNTGRDVDFGYGRVDAYAAVTRALDNIANPSGYLLRSGGEEWAVPVVEQFVVDRFVGGTLLLVVGSDDDWDGVLGETGEYYGSWTGPVEFTGKYFDVEVPITKQ